MSVLDLPLPIYAKDIGEVLVHADEDAHVDGGAIDAEVTEGGATFESELEEWIDWAVFLVDGDAVFSRHFFHCLPGVSF